MLSSERLKLREDWSERIDALETSILVNVNNSVSRIWTLHWFYDQLSLLGVRRHRRIPKP